MPFLIKIILQRILIFVYSVLTFLGIAPEISIPTEPEAIQIIENRQNIIKETFVDNNIFEKTKEKLGGIIEKAENNLIDIQLPEVSEIPITLPNPDLPSITKAISEAEETLKESPINIGVLPDETTSIENVIVNTVCVRRNGNAIHVSTGSGVFVSPKGVILTNSHIGQFFLIQDANSNLIDCSIYKENIPTYGYKARVLHLSPEWIQENYRIIGGNNARGTGENDYALLLITGNTNPTLSVPSSFPAATISLDKKIEVGQKITATGYPGSPSLLLDITKSVSLKIDKLFIADIFTFDDGDIDIFSTLPSKVGAKGSSGGGIFLGHNLNNTNLMGIITTTNGQSGNAIINAISTSYINRDLLETQGNSLSYYLSGNLNAKANSFWDKHGGGLAALLLSEL